MKLSIHGNILLASLLHECMYLLITSGCMTDL